MRTKLYFRSKLIRDNKVAIRIIGELDRLPKNVFDAVQNAMELTKSNSNYVINACFPYTSRAELLNASRFATGDSLTPSKLAEKLYTLDSPPLDFLLRTSGEFRLSEFLTWQSVDSECPIHFLSVYWPALRLWHLLPSLLQFQAKKIQS